jgi:two-component system, OmpR family, sensor kinase
MKVRTKFTLWISLTALSTATLFSMFVYFELLKEPYRLIDRELFEIGEAVFMNLDFSKSGEAVQLTNHFDYPIERYWLKIFDGNGRTIFVSPLARHFDIQLPEDRKAFFIQQNLPDASRWIFPEDIGETHKIRNNKVPFRVRALTKDRSEGHYTILIAKPLPSLIIELRELVYKVTIGIIGAIFLIFLLSYFLAGRILRPLSIINHNIKEIRENSLNRRIPLGVSRDELYILSHSLNLMFDRLQYSFSRQKEFIGNAAHELKSPLTILMLGHEEMLANRPPHPIRFELEKQLNTMRRLSKLVRNLLDISRLEQEETCLHEPIRIDMFIRQVLKDYREILQAKDIIVETEIEECLVSGDPEKILRLLINLIDNAIKYNNAKKGYIKVTTEVRKGFIIITIANTGPEIPPADLPRIFDQFYRFEKSRSPAFGGSGLGLTIAQKIIEQHGGTVEVKSHDGWSTFTLNLPWYPHKKNSEDNPPT